MKKQFLENIGKNQGILHKVVSIYENDPEDKKDLFQEILYQLWKSYPRFEARSAFSTWMYRIALNTALLRQRKKYVSHKGDSELSREIIQNPGEQEKKISLYMAIDQLNRIDKAICLLYLEQKNYREIAGIMGMSKNNIGVRINRIKKQLKKVLDYEQRK
jgi:RNA polymerase sigma-70 factor (ECF subfamily)